MDADDGLLQRPRAPNIPMLRERSRWHVCFPGPRRFFQGPDTDDKEVASPFPSGVSWSSRCSHWEAHSRGSQQGQDPRGPQKEIKSWELAFAL